VDDGAITGVLIEMHKKVLRLTARLKMSGMFTAIGLNPTCPKSFLTGSTHINTGHDHLR
jgi:hypothetical protein